MVKFIQPTEVEGGGVQLPSEALLIDGVPIENVLDGYRTLTVQGRELMGQVVNTEPMTGADGSILIDHRYPERLITVQYKLEANNREEFRSRFNMLNRILAGRDKELRFLDETSYYFTGTLESVDSVPTGSNSVVSSFTFLCEDPFKYSDKTSVSGTAPVIHTGNPYRLLPAKIDVTMSGGGSGEVSISHGGKMITVDPVDYTPGTVVSFDFDDLMVYVDGSNEMRNLKLMSDFEDFYIVSGEPFEMFPSGNIKVYFQEVEL